MIGQTLKHYKIEQLLGKGGMGVVYRALDTRLQRPVALKLLEADLVSDPARKSRFLVEAQSAAAITHPAIAQIYDVDEVDGMMFIAMEFIDGRTVGRLIAEGELDLQGSVEVALQVAEGLAKAHDAGIIHRDIKSDNIMVTRDGHAKLLDFGLAKLLDAPAAEPGPGFPGASSRTLTMEQVHTIAGAVLGTISYMSPEQARGRSLDLRSDIFSFGIVLYEMVTGELPFKGESPLDTMHAIAFEEAKPVTALRKNLPPQVQQIISRCLRKRPENRYLDAHALAADLKRLKHDLETGTRLTLPPGERLREWLEQVKTWLPFGTKGIYILAAALILTAVLIVTNIQWGNIFWIGFVAFMVYRGVRNRKRRLLNSFTKKASPLPGVKAVVIRDEGIIVVLEKAPATTYIRITSLIESINNKLYFGRPVSVSIKDEMSEAEFMSLIRQPGVAYVKEDILIDPTGGKPNPPA
jgi:serine/threonine protein kinase